MSSIEQQLFETRKAMLLDRIKDQPASMQQAAVRSLQRMQFEDAADFSEWLNENSSTDLQSSASEVSEEQLDDIMDHMGLGRLKSLAQKAAPKKDSIDEIIDSMF